MLHLVHLLGLQDPLTDASLQGADDVLSFTMSERRGQTAEVSLEIRNPGLSLLTRSNYVAVIESPDGTVRNGKVLCRARVAHVPSDLKGTTATLMLTCCPASYAGDLETAANAACNGAAIPPWTVRVVPQPDPGIISVVFSGTAGSPASWANLRAGAFRVQSFFQEDLIRSVYARISWNTLNAANALLVLTLPAGAPTVAAKAAAQAGKFALIGVSADTTPSHAAFFTYGKVMRTAPSPGGGIDVYVNLSDPSLTGSGFAYAEGDPTRAGLPFYDPLFGGDTTDLATTALEGRSQAWHIDPVTHFISLEPFLSGPVTDLGALGDDASTEFTAGQSPVKHVKLRVTAEWEQHAVGPVDIASVIATAAGPSGSISTLQDNVKEPKGDQKLEFRAWGGWTKGDWTTDSFISQSQIFWTGRTMAVQYRYSTKYPPIQNPDTGVFADPKTVKGDPWTVEHKEYGRTNIRNIGYTSAWCTYDYTQPRREVVDLVLDCECQDSVQATDTAVLPPITLGDLLTVAGVSPYQPGTVYNAGDRVSYFGHVWECLADGTLYFWSLVSKASQGVSGLSIRTQQIPVNWRDLGTLAPLSDARAPSFFDTPRGFGCLQHALMRMRAAALRRLEMITITRVFPWAPLTRDIALTDRVRVLVRTGETATPFIGKVTAIERRVVGDGQATVKLTLAVPTGTGRLDTVADADGTDAIASGYVEPDYTAVSTPAYLAAQVTQGSTTFSVGSDVEAVLTPEPLELPVDAFRLQDPWYAVETCFIDNQADKQLSIALARAAAGNDPRAVTRDYPTTLEVGMRFIPTHATIVRQYRVHAILLSSPRGVDLAGGGEP